MVPTSAERTRDCRIYRRLSNEPRIAEYTGSWRMYHRLSTELVIAKNNYEQGKRKPTFYCNAHSCLNYASAFLLVVCVRLSNYRLSAGRPWPRGEVVWLVTTQSLKAWVRVPVGAKTFMWGGNPSCMRRVGGFTHISEYSDIPTCWVFFHLCFWMQL